jgi:hypothetical protein
MSPMSEADRLFSLALHAQHHDMNDGLEIDNAPVALII